MNELSVLKSNFKFFTVPSLSQECLRMRREILSQLLLMV